MLKSYRSLGVGAALCVWGLLVQGGCGSNGPSGSTDGAGGTASGGAASGGTASGGTASGGTASGGTANTAGGGQAASGSTSGAGGENSSGGIHAGGALSSGGVGGSAGAGADGSGGTTGGGLGLMVDGWGYVRCFEESTEFYVCTVTYADGTVGMVEPACKIAEYDNRSHLVRVGGSPNQDVCGQGPDELSAWDEVVCWESNGDAYFICLARKGDWAVRLTPECELDDEGEIFADDLNFLECSYDQNHWDEVRCFLPDDEDYSICNARTGDYWVYLEQDCDPVGGYNEDYEVDPLGTLCE